MKKKQILLFAIVLGAVAMVLVWSFLSSVEKKYREEAKLINVLTARVYIPEGKIVNRAMVQTTKVPKGFVQPNALTSTKDLVNPKGKNIYSTVVPIAAGEQILTTKLTTLGRETGLALAIPKGKRAISIEARGLTPGLIKPGDYVDVLGTFSRSRVKEGKTVVEEETRTILQNILVLACGTEMVSTEKRRKVKGGLLGREALRRMPSSVTLSVTPEEAEIITFAQRKGALNLVLRPVGETEIFTVPPVDFETISKER